MPKKISTRCGKMSCKYYDESNTDSKCYIYTSRLLCPKSVKQQRTVARKAKLKALNRMYMW